ncbi:MAG: hypothetical protein J7604_21095 [Sporocytophaga sp.]|nr:hypothetical protein [Sporocytophaga sp.]MBO9702722.1 hypothetical protein [Sporocytophaga sp.]
MNDSVASNLMFEENGFGKYLIDVFDVSSIEVISHAKIPVFPPEHIPH